MSDRKLDFAEWQAIAQFVLKHGTPERAAPPDPTALPRELPPRAKGKRRSQDGGVAWAGLGATRRE